MPGSHVGSSIFLSVGRLDHIEIPADQSDYALSIGDMSACYPGQSDVDDGAGLSQGSAIAPSAFLQPAGQEPSVLAGVPDYSSGDEVVRDMLVE